MIHKGVASDAHSLYPITKFQEGITRLVMAGGSKIPGGWGTGTAYNKFAEIVGHSLEEGIIFGDC